MVRFAPRSASGDDRYLPLRRLVQFPNVALSIRIVAQQSACASVNQIVFPIAPGSEKRQVGLVDPRKPDQIVEALAFFMEEKAREAGEPTLAGPFWIE